MHRSIKKLLCLAMVSVMVLGAFPIMASAAPARDTAFMAGNQIVVQICETEFHHYFPAWWGERVSRQLIRNPDGSILELNVEQSSFTAQLQDAEGEIVFARNISFELPLFGALFSGENYNFAAFGQSNWDERTDVEVIRIVRYDKQWNRIDDLRLFGGVYGDFGHHGYRNVANPFGGGASRFAEYGDTLVLHMGRHMYHCMCDIRGGARHNHQSALYVFVDIPTMTFVPTGGLPWVSHSFNQFPIFANGQPVFLDKGTGFPRTLAVHRGREYTQRFYYIFQHDGTRRDMDARDWAAVGYVYRYYYFIRPNGSFQPLTRTDWGEYFYHSQDGLWTAHFVPAQYVNLAERNVHIDTGIHRFFDYGILYETPGSTGDNFMGVSIGGFGASSQNFIASVNIAPAFNYVANRQRNIYTLTLPLDFVVDEIGQRNRIATMEGTNRIASVPVMSQVGFDSFALMWREFEMLAPITQSVTPYNTVPLEFVVQYVDGRGLPVGQPLRFDTKDAMLAEVLMIGYEGSIFPPVETAPAITSVANTSVQYDSGGTFQVVAIGTAPIVFSLADAPAGVSINSTSGLITVAPNSLEIGVHTFRVVASGTVAPDAEQIFTLTVTDAPALHSVTILGGGAGASATPNPASVGERVNLHAGQAPSGQVFQNWTVSPSAIALTNATSPTAANFEMIDAPVEVTANWQNATITQPPAQPSARPPASGGGGWVGNIIIRPGGTPPVQPAPPTPVTPEVLPDIVTAVVYPANVTHVHTVVQNQISAGVNNVVLALPTGYSAVSVTASTLQAIAAASVNLTVVVDSASVTIPVAALPNIIQQGSGDFDINVGTVAIDIGISVDVSISSEGASITNLSAPISVDVVLEDIGAVNHHRIVAILDDGTLVGGSFNPVSGAFTFDTEITGEFIITYVEHLNRLVLQIGGTTITCLAGNAVTQFMDVAPVIQDGRTLLPVRFMAYALNAEVGWTPETDTSPLIVSLNLDGTPLSFGIGEITPELAELGMDVPAQIISNRTMVPLRFISEFFGAVVTWDDTTRTVQIIKG